MVWWWFRVCVCVCVLNSTLWASKAWPQGENVHPSLWSRHRPGLCADSHIDVKYQVSFMTSKNTWSAISFQWLSERSFVARIIPLHDSMTPEALWPSVQGFSRQRHFFWVVLSLSPMPNLRPAKQWMAHGSDDKARIFYAKTLIYFISES